MFLGLHGGASRRLTRVRAAEDVVVHSHSPFSLFTGFPRHLTVGGCHRGFHSYLAVTGQVRSVPSCLLVQSCAVAGGPWLSALAQSTLDMVRKQRAAMMRRVREAHGNEHDDGIPVLLLCSSARLLSVVDLFVSLRLLLVSHSLARR